MIVVKLTILFIVITAIYGFAVRVWATNNPGEALAARIMNQWPKWLYELPLFIMLDIVGIFASTI